MGLDEETESFVRRWKVPATDRMNHATAALRRSGTARGLGAWAACAASGALSSGGLAAATTLDGRPCRRCTLRMGWPRELKPTNPPARCSRAVGGAMAGRARATSRDGSICGERGVYPRDLGPSNDALMIQTGVESVRGGTGALRSPHDTGLGALTGPRGEADQVSLITVARGSCSSPNAYR